MIRHIKEFDKRAKSYSTNNYIQKQIVDDLLNFDSRVHQKILDIGCGNGLIRQNLKFTPELFIGIDASSKMLEIHPVFDDVKLINKNFDDTSIYEEFIGDIDMIYSSSALQWSKHLNNTLQKIQKFKNFALAIHTDNTFKELRQTLKTDTFLPSLQNIKDSLYRNVKYEVKTYQIEFENNQDLLKYIKNTGISSGQKKLTTRDLREFLTKNNKKYLKFEVLFIKDI